MRCRRVGTCRLSPPLTSGRHAKFISPTLYGDLVPREVRDAIRFVLRPDYRKTVIRRRRQKRYPRLREESEPRLWELCGGVILSGPFKGLMYPRESVGSAWAPKLLGTYESELSPTIERIVSGGYRSVVDIGAAEGYYAVGLAK